MAFIPIYILILFVTIIVDYNAGIWIEKLTGGPRKWCLILSIVSNIGFLAFFKYYNFLNANLTHLAQWLHWNYPISALEIILPIGLSFHTFQAMSYTIEVYRGNQKAEKHFGIFALYVMFYPQLVAGPIERPQNLLHQFREEHDFNYKRVTRGLKFMIWGLFKKVVIADRLAVVVNHVYAQPAESTGIALILATIFFAFQIYCDFSGYSAIAIGSAEVMGFKLMTNFNWTYASKSISEFWKRWHISLSTWFRDYLYIPMGGSRTTQFRWYWNIFFTFLISGLWHGANWTYMIWGGLNGFYLFFAIWTKNIRKKVTDLSGLSSIPALHNALKTVVTFFLICFAWIFFRAGTVQYAFYIISKLFSDFTKIADISYLKHEVLIFSQIGLTPVRLIFCIASIIVLEMVQKIIGKGNVLSRLDGKPIYVRWAAYYGLILGIVLFGVFKNDRFIYFQF
jgi:D-alanyl-lipoteichoic acid acyltransferase DltB (MBOAT superfamily)